MTGELKISIIMPVYNTPKDYLDRCVASVLSQVYENWQLIIVDDASPAPEIKGKLRNTAEFDPRITLKYLEQNVGISKATNAGLSMVDGEFVVFLDHDDELTSDALGLIAKCIKEQPDVDVIYSDQLKFDEDGNIIDHFYKPDWSPIYAIGVMYIGHLVAVRTGMFAMAGSFNGDFDGVQDYEFFLRLSEKTDRIVHLRSPLYKWRAIRGSVASSPDAKRGIGELQRRAAQDHIDRIGRTWRVSKHATLPHRLTIAPSEKSPTPGISIIIPTRDQGLVLRACLESIYSMTNYPDYEVIIVDNQTTDPIALTAIRGHPNKVFSFDKKFNFSEACNMGAQASNKEFVLFLNNDTEILDAEWLRKLVCYFEDPMVGATGPVLLYNDGRVQHAGIVLGARGTADHVMRFFPPDVDGYAGSLACSREVSGVTAACLLMPRHLFNELGQFSTDYNKHYQDVDLCLKIRKSGFRIINVANTRVIHHESISRGLEGYDMGDRAILIDHWHETISAGDPYYNENLSLARLDYSLWP